MLCQCASRGHTGVPGCWDRRGLPALSISFDLSPLSAVLEHAATGIIRSPTQHAQLSPAKSSSGWELAQALPTAQWPALHLLRRQLPLCYAGPSGLSLYTSPTPHPASTMNGMVGRWDILKLSAKCLQGTQSDKKGQLRKGKRGQRKPAPGGGVYMGSGSKST